MNIYTRDKDKLTPLHWACDSNSEIAQVYLLAWYDQERLNMQTNDGSTALHLTVKAADSLGSGRPMRALLMAGINKNLKDNKGKTPAYYTQGLKNKKVARELQDQLFQKSRCSCL